MNNNLPVSLLTSFSFWAFVTVKISTKNNIIFHKNRVQNWWSSNTYKCD